MPDVNRDDVQVVVIDGRLWYDGRHRALGMLDAAHNLSGGGPRIRFEHYEPKPSVWQGPERLTGRDYFCAASVRNTAFAYARGEHVIFVDDLSVVLPGWLKAHVHAAQHGYVLCGTTCKQKGIRVDADGHVVDYTPFPPGQDSRIPQIVGELMTCSGSWLFGGTFSVPLELALRVNGQDEINDTIGGEDYDFGIRLERAGGVIRIARSCRTFEDEDGHHAEAPMMRLDKPWPGPDGPYTSNYLLNTLVRDHARSWTIGNGYNLRELRETILNGGRFTEPSVFSGAGTFMSGRGVRHWVDQQPLEEM